MISLHLFISYIGREYQDIKLKENNDDNVRKDAEHLEVNRENKTQLSSLFLLLLL